MAISRRLFLTGSASGAGILLLSACTGSNPAPSASPTPVPSSSPTATSDSPGVRPKASRRSSWGTDPYAYGSTSYLAVGATDSDRATLRAPLADKLFFAGEAVASTAPGTLVGARASGLEAAAAVAAVATSGERIAVIGAGMAGASAARDLADRGFDVVVVEARHRIGGRISSYASDDWPIEVQLGVAALFGDGAPDLESLVNAEGAVTVPLDDTSAARVGSKETTVPADPAALASVRTAFAWSEKQSAELSVADALRRSGAESMASSVPDATGVSDADRLAFVLDDILPARFGASPANLSARSLGADLLPSGVEFVTKGFSDFVTAQLTDLDVLRGSNVTQIDYGNQGIGLRLVTGESLSADRVVSTIPLGVLKKHKIVFQPALPAAQLKAIDALGMGVQDVLWLRFDERLWSTDATVWAVLDEPAAYKLWLNLEPSTGYPILVALTGGAAAKATEKLGDSEAVDAAVASIAAYLDLAPPTGSPTPTPSVSPAP